VCQNKISCRNLHKRLEIPRFVSQYILLVTPFLVRNKNLFILNSKNHTKSTRQFTKFYQLTTNFTVYQSAVHYVGIKVFNNLPPCINPINVDLNCMCQLLTFFRTQKILHVSRIRVKDISNNVKKFEIFLKTFPTYIFFQDTEEKFQYKSATS